MEVYLVQTRKSRIFAADIKTWKIMATAIKAIPTLYGEEARRFGEAALHAELNYDPQKRNVLSERRRSARQLMKQAGLIATI